MKQYVVFDSHCDTPAEIWRKKETMERNSCHVSLPRARSLGGYGQFFAFCTLPGCNTGYTCQQLLWEPYHYFMEQLRENEQTMMLCTKGQQYDEALAAGKTAAFLSIEGPEGFDCDPGRLEEIREAGITMLNLNWNADNALCGCSKYDGPGLSAQGKEFVRRAQQLGMIIDVSHTSDRAFWDLMDITEKPVVASHSNSRVLCGHSRNLTDEMFKALCDCGGYAGINLCDEFLDERPGAADLEAIYRHIDHFLNISGGGHVALGGDLDGIEILPKGVSGVDSYQKLAQLLENKGFSSETIENIYSKTMKKVVTVCTM